MSRRALGVLALVVLALAAALLLAPAPVAVVGRGRVLSGRPARVVLERPGLAPVVVEVTAATVDGFPADPGALRDLLGTLELLSARRRVPSADAAARGLDAPRLTVGIDAARLRFGRVVPGLGQVWATLGEGEDLLLDAHALRALELGRDDLRRRAPFTFAPTDVARIVVGPVALRGSPLCVELPGGCARAHRDRVAGLLGELIDLELSSFLDAPPAGEPELSVTVGDETLAIHGVCAGAAGARAVTSPAGPGCVAAEAAARLLAQPRDPLAWVATRALTLSPAAIDRVELGGVVLERRGGTWSRGEEPVSAEAVRELLGELAELRGTPERAAPVSTRPAGASEVRVRAGDLEEILWLAGDDHVVRPGEPVFLRVPEAARLIFARDPALLADRRVLAFDPHALVRITATPPLEIAERGATGESWTVVAPLAIDADHEVVMALRDAAATLTAQRIVASRPLPAHGFPGRRLTFETAATPGAEAATQVLELGAPTADGGCHARRGEAPAVYAISGRACAALRAHLPTRVVFPFAPGEVTAVTIRGRRVEHRGGAWVDASGERLSESSAREHTELVRSLATARSVERYGVPRGDAVTVESGDMRVDLRVGRELYGRDGGFVIYRRDR